MHSEHSGHLLVMCDRCGFHWNTKHGPLEFGVERYRNYMRHERKEKYRKVTNERPDTNDLCMFYDIQPLVEE